MNGRTNKLHKLRTLHLFAGSGGGLLGDILLGHHPVCAVEIDTYCQQVLHARQKDGILPWFPIFADVKEFDGKPWRGIVDVVCGGFPCQDISCAGKGAGITGERSGLWKEMARVVCEVRPRYVFVENSPMLTIRGFGTVLGDLAEMGYDARWGVFSAAEIGCIHRRERIFILASNDHEIRCHWRKPERKGVQRPDATRHETVPSIDSDHRQKRVQGKFQKTVSRQSRFPWRESIRRVEDLFGRPDIPDPLFRRMDDVVANYVDRIGAAGNGQVPSVVALAWETLMP